MSQAVKRVAIVGAGVIGSGWAARFLAAGLDVVAWDPAPGAEATTRAAVALARRTLEKRGLAPGASPERLSFAPAMETCVEQADFIPENAPELTDELIDKVAAGCEDQAAGRDDFLVDLLALVQKYLPGVEGRAERL